MIVIGIEVRIMFQVYVLSVLIWSLIFYFELGICGKSIINNGWTKDSKPINMHPLALFMLIVATPVVRTLFCAVCIMMALVTKEQFEEWMKKYEDD